MLLVDTSAWIEFLRATGSRQHLHLRDTIAAREAVVIDPVLMEVMAGSRPGAVEQTRRLLDAQRREALVPRIDWLGGATIFRELRRSGVTVRSPIDAVIAAVAIRTGLAVLHRDRDFDAIAAHTELQVVPSDDGADDP